MGQTLKAFSKTGFGENFTNVITYNKVLHAGFFKVSPCWLLRHFKRPKLFILNTDTIVKRGLKCFSVVVIQLDSAVLWETVGIFWRPFRSLKVVGQGFFEKWNEDWQESDPNTYPGSLWNFSIWSFSLIKILLHTSHIGVFSRPLSASTSVFQ